MHSPALALSWQLWGRHRWGLSAVLLYCLTTALVFNALPAGTLEPRHGLLVSFQFIIAVIYVAAVFAYGFESPLEVRASGFPARLFTLPVRTSVLVAWPMLQGMGTVALLVVAWAYLVLRPSGTWVSLQYTALAAAAFVAVLQALLWLPFGLPWARVIVAFLVLSSLILTAMLGPAYDVPESDLLALFAALIALAGGAAFVGVSRARRGEAPDWSGPFRSLPTFVPRRLRPAARFTTPARAQLWFECRRHLLTFPLVVGWLAAAHLAFALWVETRSEDKARLGIHFLTFAPLLAPFFGCFLGRAGTSVGNPYPLSSFGATRPLSSSALVAAKLQVAALATLAAWAVVLLAASVWFVHTGMYETAQLLWNHLLREYPAWRIAATSLLALLVLLLITWRLLIDSLWIGLTGRIWIVRGSLLGFGVALTLAGMMFAHFFATVPGFMDRLQEALPTWAAGAVLLKLLVAGCVGHALLRRGLVRPWTVAKYLGFWILAVAGLFALACAAILPDAVRMSWLAFGAVLLVPLARLAAAPLALDWNRHR
jgi:hypothetical protein